jgi:23S rRNA pseudouridine1911/1915/1917 synthase
MQHAIEIIYQDNDIMLVNKPSGVSVTADRGGNAELIEILSDQLGQTQARQLRLTHRLDKQTSGVMLLAKNTLAQSQFSSCFEKRLMTKTYLAIVTGIVNKTEGVIKLPLAQSAKDFQKMRVDTKRGKEALTKWRLLADFGTIALLAVYPVTVRTHQIRVHLPAAKMPLAIDPLYGTSEPLYLSNLKAKYRLGKGQIEKPLIDRLTLHAYQLELPKPQSDRPDCFVAPLEKKFAATIKMLTKHNPRGSEAFTDTETFPRIIAGKPLSVTQ